MYKALFNSYATHCVRFLVISILCVSTNALLAHEIEAQIVKEIGFTATIHKNCRVVYHELDKNTYVVCQKDGNLKVRTVI